MTPSDQELIALICKHDASAFEVLSARYREVIYRHILHAVHDNDATEDVVQEVFLRIWTRAEQWNGRGTFKAWLFRIATNLTLNYLRTLRRCRQQPLEMKSIHWQLVHAKLLRRFITNGQRSDERYVSVAQPGAFTFLHEP